MTNNKEHVLICIIGESASGKDRLITELCNRNGWSQLISYTTRPRRNHEGDTHLFVDEDTYKAMEIDGSVAAYTNINGNHYWSTVEQLYQNDFYAIDFEGIKTLKALNLPDLHIVTVYINVPEEVRKERAKMRGDDMNVYRSRCLSEKQQFRDMKKDADFDYSVSNLYFPTACSILRWICIAEGIWRNHVEEEST